MGEVADRIREEIASIRADSVAPGLAAVAASLAEVIDDKQAGATGKSNAARELRAVMNDLRKLAPVIEEGDGVDDISRQRKKRRAELLEQQSAAGE